MGWEGGGSEWVGVWNHSTDVGMGWARNEGVRLNAEVDVGMGWAGNEGVRLNAEV